MLWLAHGANGVTRFNPDDETFVRFRHDPDDTDSLAGDVVFNVFEDALGRIWFSGPQGAGGLTILDPRTGHFKRLKMAPERSRTPITAGSSGALWRVSRGGSGSPRTPSSRSWIRERIASELIGRSISAQAKLAGVNSPT